MHLAEAISEASSAATVLFFLDAHILGGSTRDAVRVDLIEQDAIGAVAHLVKRAVSRVEEAADELFAELAR